MRISKTNLEEKVNFINSVSVKEYDLNYSSTYGGWQLTTNNGSHIVCHRIPAKEMYAYLNGYIDSILDFKYKSINQ